MRILIVRVILELTYGFWSWQYYYSLSSRGTWQPFHSSVASEATAFSFKRCVKLFSATSFKAIAKYETGNLVYSPVGVSIILTMMAFGARARTKAQLRSGLRLPFDDVETKNEIMTILSDVEETHGYELHLANKMFYNASRRLKYEFVNMARSVFNSPTRKVNFADYSSTRTLINAWSALQTNNCIPEIFEPWAITDETKLLLASVAYFKGNWSWPFESDRTVPREFYINGTTAQNVTTMFVNGYFRYGEIPEADAKFVELPYKVSESANTLSMYVILPNKRNGLATLVENFHKIDEFTLLGGFARKLSIYLPKFKFKGSIDLNKPLDKMGFYDMFTRSADFRGIVEELSFTVRSFVQIASIEVDENDDKNASVRILDLHHQLFFEEFRVEHPFVCVIMKENAIPLFIAIIKDPLRTSNPTERMRPRPGVTSFGEKKFRQLSIPVTKQTGNPDFFSYNVSES